MTRLARMSEISGADFEQDNFIKPALIGGNVVACFADGKIVPHQKSASVFSSVDGFTELTVTVVVRNVIL